MKRCAYCSGQGKKFTKEHVIPNWYIEHNKSPNDVSFLERAPKKFISEMVIRDVCDECNNRHLSGLDAYGKELYNRYFEHYVFEDEIVEFKYNYQRLLKWLIKCSYNSARVHNADLEVLKDYAEILIGGLRPPCGRACFLFTNGSSSQLMRTIFHLSLIEITQVSCMSQAGLDWVFSG
jgi:hypothetical protein